jgi:hypothetical protein
MTDSHPFITTLFDDAKCCEQAEQEFRATMNARVAELAQARAFAYRRMNVMRSLFDAVSSGQERDAAVARAVDMLRDRLGWRDDSDARQEVLVQYEKVAQTAFDAVHPSEESAVEPDIGEVLAGFENWYTEARGKPFWVLFEHYMPETQLVDF